MTAQELLEELEYQLSIGVNEPTQGEVERILEEIRSGLKGVPERAMIAIIGRIIEEYSMHGTFSGQCSDVPNYFSDTEWEEIENLSLPNWKDFCPAGLLDDIEEW